MYIIQQYPTDATKQKIIRKMLNANIQKAEEEAVKVAHRLALQTDMNKCKKDEKFYIELVLLATPISFSVSVDKSYFGDRMTFASSIEKIKMVNCFNFISNNGIGFEYDFGNLNAFIIRHLYVSNAKTTVRADDCQCGFTEFIAFEDDVFEAYTKDCVRIFNELYTEKDKALLSAIESSHLIYDKDSDTFNENNVVLTDCITNL